MDNKSKITRSASFVGLLTFLSRILGMARDIVIAFFFGAGPVTDAFWVAFRIPNLLRRLFAEGALTVSFIPVFTERLEKDGKEKAKLISDAVFTILIIILVLTSILGIIFSPYIIKLFASGFDQHTFKLSVLLNRIMFPYILFISLTALCMGILNSLKHFFAPTFSPVLFNICIILFALFLHEYFDIPIVSLAIGVLVGGILQLLLQVPFLRSRGFLFQPNLMFKNPDVKRILKLMIPQVFGLGVYNLNIIVNTQYASYLPEGTISYLFFSERLIEFPLGIVAVSLGTVLLPNFSSYLSRGQISKFKETYEYSLRLLLYVMVPSMFGLIFLSKPICNLLYQRGEFGYTEMIYTSQSLVGYALGIWAVGALRITVQAFFANKDTKTPVLIAFCAFIMNAVFGYLLGFKFGLNHVGLAISASLSSVFYFITLLVLIHKRIAKINFQRIIIFFIKILILGFIMGIIVYKTSGLSNWTNDELSISKIATLIFCVVIGFVFYLGVSKVLKIKESDEILKIMRIK